MRASLPLCILGHMLQFCPATSSRRMGVQYKVFSHSWYLMQDARCEMRDARCKMRDARCEMQDARCEMQDAR